MAYDAHGAYMGSANVPMPNVPAQPGSAGAQPSQKNYVFVDEHNRHKRLKVMRACEGCRRRKIKCDAATTNTWPCSACRRLKLHCQPPSINQDGSGSGQLTDNELDYAQGPAGGLDFSTVDMDNVHYGSIPPSQFPSDAQYAAQMTNYGISQFADRVDNQPPAYQQSQPALSPYSQHQTKLPSRSQAASYYSPPRLHTASSSSPLDLESSNPDTLSEAFGDLKIDETGVAPYVRQAHTPGKEQEGPVQDFDVEVKLPPLSTGAGSQIRIPPALMPSEEDAMRYFQVFFDNVHPYVPVINRAHFMRQWHNDRASISPLLLESLFACSGRLLDDPAQGAQWLALAARHEDYFLDHPRLSTLQGLLLLLKARESAPKKGYFYKSWMTVKTAVSMARSLELDEHFSDHENGGSCDSDPVECLTKTRIWQTLLILEVIVGGPQGRHDFGVNLETVDLRTNPPSSNMSTYEAELSRHFAYWVRTVRNIHALVVIYAKIRKQKDWYANPKFVAQNETFRNWPEELPEDLRISFPADGSPPWIPSHFIGNMHSHYHLGIIILQRPQLLASKSFGADAQWRQIFSTCYTSAKFLCRLQEAILARWGMSGLQVMQRGINFTIYAVLTCTMLHLVAITSPYPQFSDDAPEYFTRHMRILEQCTSAWPMPEVREQVDSIRLAFSADINKPFELKSSFPYSSPSDGYQSSPPVEMQYPHQLSHENSFEHSSQLQYHSITPPISAAPGDLKSDSPVHMQQPMGMHPSSHPQANSSMTQEQLRWNPSRIMTQWNSAFAIPAAAMAPPGPSTSPPMNMPMAPGSATMSQQQQQNQYASQYSSQEAGMAHLTTAQQLQAAGYMDPVFVSPRDWQQSVASVYDPEGQKRRWEVS